MARKRAEESESEEDVQELEGVPEHRCETCPHGDFPNDEGLMGWCQIRSVPQDQFPERHRNDWCGEHPELVVGE